MFKCISCERWWARVWPNKGTGTCMLDGARTNSDYGCGFHSDKIPILADVERAPDKRCKIIQLRKKKDA